MKGYREMMCLVHGFSLNILKMNKHCPRRGMYMYVSARVSQHLFPGGVYWVAALRTPGKTARAHPWRSVCQENRSVWLWPLCFFLCSEKHEMVLWLFCVPKAEILTEFWKIWLYILVDRVELKIYDQKKSCDWNAETHFANRGSV